MPEVQVRKKFTAVEEIFHEGGPVAYRPAAPRRCAGSDPQSLCGRVREGNRRVHGRPQTPWVLKWRASLVTALGGDQKVVEGYGKGAIVGSAGELEHGALWHAPGGYGMREVLGNAKAIVSSTKKVGGPGTRLDVPITHINASYVRSHFDAMEVGLADAPRADEILLALVMTTGPRIHARAGGLKASEIKGEDGLRDESQHPQDCDVFEETRTEMGRAVDPPTRRAAAVAVIENPFAGKYVDDLSELMAIGEELGELLTQRAVAALGIAGTTVESYGKAAAVGENGELEHAAAILHPKLGTPVRKVLGKGAALIPSSKKRGGLGVLLDIPLGHKDAAFVRSHFDGMEVTLNDAPRANEIMVAVAVTDSGRPLPRVGGLAKGEIKGEDGLR